jgi:iron(III) transport system substrate-binding protein
MSSLRFTSRSVAVLLAVLAVLAAACSSPPTSTQEGETQGRLGDAAARLKELDGQLAGLDGKARRDKLAELADKEGGRVNAYGSTNLDDISPMIDKFQEDTGIEVNYYRASSSDILQRVLQEADANFPGADVIFTNGPELTVIDQRKLLAPLNSPVTKDIPKQGVLPNWAWLYVNTFAASWNTDRVRDTPRSWEDVLAYGKGLALEVGDFDWFATLVKSYFVEEKGMTEEQAVELFRKAANGAALVDGHTLMGELLASGEYDVAASTYLHRILQLKKDKAHVEWEGGPEPIIIRPNGIAIHRNARSPAAGLLFLEFMLTDAQPMLLDIDRQAASTSVQGGGLPSGVNSRVVDLAALLDEREKWEGLWEKIIEGSGGEVIEG